MKTDSNVLPGSLAGIITARMQERGVSIRQVAIQTGVVYEHIRRMCKGEGAPSEYVLKDICEFLELDFKELNRQLQWENMTPEQREMSLEMSVRNPELAPIEQAWDHLTPQQRQDAIMLITDWAKA